MAKVFYLLKQNKVKNSKVNGKWFARQKTIETLNTRKLANHISEHGSIYTPDVVFGVLEKFRSCLLEMLLNSKRVKIDGLGIFFTTLENTEGGAESKDKFLPQKNLKGLHIRFLPDSSTETDISSREFIKKAEFVNAETFAGSLEDESSNGGSGGGSSSSSGSGSQSSGSGSQGGNTGGNTGGGGDGDDDVTYD
jgi:predicted histone-like DNA-binding protein